MLTGMGNACFLNLLIAPTQLIAAFIGIFDGLSTMGSSYKRYSVLSSGRRRCRAVALQRGLEADYFVVEDLVASEASKSYHEWITALWDVVCGVCFLFLTANSLCIISLKPVIDALTVMEVALIYFLYLMWTAYTSARTQQTATESLAAALAKKRSLSAEGMELYSLLLTGMLKSSWSYSYPFLLLALRPGPYCLTASNLLHVVLYPT